jgi:hypothetical protein
MNHSRLLALLLPALLAGCGAPTAAEPAAPSPTIVAAPPRDPVAVPTLAATALPATAAPLALATSPPSPASAAEEPAGAETPFAYLWPAYLPDGMAPAARESRIAADGELGPGDIGFFVVTWNGGGRKLVIGGGAAEPFPLSGRITTMELGGRGARLVTNENQRQLTLSGTEGNVFVYGAGLDEAELVKVAASLRPIDVADLRQRVDVP